MKKIILALALSAFLIVGQLTSFAEETNPVKAVDGNVTISATVNAAEGTPVLIVILPEITNRDVTEDKVQGLTTTEILTALDVEYLALEYVSGGKVEHTCVMKNSLSTGVCHVVFNYLGAEDGCYSVGTFEHVGESDKVDLLNALNGANKDTCAPIIDKDINGKLDTDGETVLEVAKEILRKSSADVPYYITLDDEEKTKFHEMLYSLKGENTFDLPLLIDCFNKAGIWTKLSFEEDTLGVLNTYNGEGIGKYWNVDIGESSDFASLSTEEKNALLTKIKGAGYSDKTLLETDFHNGVMMAMFRSVTTREELVALISTESKYADGFTGVREIIADANLNEYKMAQLYNNVLDGNSNPSTIVDVDDIEDLFRTSIPSGGGGGGGGGSGTPMCSNDGNAIRYENNIVISPVQPDINPFPFKDIEYSHWAYAYVKKLHQNKVINGVSENEFAPEASVARQDFVKILIGALGIETSNIKSHFADVENNSYYAPFVLTAFEKGLITGMGKDIFGVGVSIKREDVAVIIDRVLTQYGKEIAENEVKFGDSSKASDYAVNSIGRVAAAGIFSGDENGNFNPKANLSRAEACAILYRLAELIKEV